MKIFLLLFALVPSLLLAQSEPGFKFGAITYADLNMTVYSKDTTAVALVLNEFGNSYLQSESPYNLELEYHVKIKILKREGFEKANFEIPLRIIGSEKETVKDIRASTFNLVNNSIKETKVETKNMFTENRNKHWDIKKFALPDVRIGSIIEIIYVLESPFIFNWRQWDFQSDIPKASSEFWAKIPGVYTYNIVLRGPLKLSKNKSDLVKKCLSVGGGVADCALFMYGMNNIPAFKEEDYMTAKENFLSAINFELLEAQRFNGTTTKYTEEWKDVDRKLQADEQFGGQIKQAKKIWSDQVEQLVKGKSDPLEKAKAVFEQIKKSYLWNETFGIFTDLGVKKAYQSKKGNIADINLSLVGALQAADLQADAVILSTRKNGTPIMLHPVMSGFNYVIARVTIGNEQYWLDATHQLHSFGFVPERCLNGKVRVMSKVSEWVDLKPRDKDKKVTQVSLKANADGTMTGSMKVTHFGYNALAQRKKYYSFSSPDDYKKEISKNWSGFESRSYSCQAVDSLEKPFVEEFGLASSEGSNADILYFSPFLVDRWIKNPFRSTERNYPVDFGAPLEEIVILEFEYPKTYVVDELPKNSALSLPLNSGRYLFSVSNDGNKIQMTSNLSLSKSVYSSEEYHSLKELFSRIVDVQQSQIVLKKKQ